MSERDAIQRGFDQFGKEAGGEKKLGSWYRRSDEVISISNLQKSQYGPSYYFNQSFWLREIADEKFPKAHKAHIVARLDDLLPDQEQRVTELLDLEHPMPDDERERQLVALLNERLLPLIERGDSIKGLRFMVDDGTFAGAGIRGPARRRWRLSSRPDQAANGGVEAIDSSPSLCNSFNA